MCPSFWLLRGVNEVREVSIQQSACLPVCPARISKQSDLNKEGLTGFGSQLQNTVPHGGEVEAAGAYSGCSLCPQLGEDSCATSASELLFPFKSVPPPPQ